MRRICLPVIKVPFVMKSYVIVSCVMMMHDFMTNDALGKYNECLQSGNVNPMVIDAFRGQTYNDAGRMTHDA